MYFLFFFNLNLYLYLAGNYGCNYLFKFINVKQVVFLFINFYINYHLYLVVFGLCFSSDSKTLVSSSDDNSIIAYNVQTKTQIGTVKHTSYVRGVCISPDDKYIVSGSHDKTIKIWELANMNQVGSIS